MNGIVMNWEAAVKSRHPLVGLIMKVLAGSDRPMSSYAVAKAIPDHTVHDVKYFISAMRHTGLIRPCGIYGDGYANPPVEYEFYEIANPLENLAYL